MPPGSSPRARERRRRGHPASDRFDEITTGPRTGPIREGVWGYRMAPTKMLTSELTNPFSVYRIARLPYFNPLK